jgi:hypothetical protein
VFADAGRGQPAHKAIKAIRAAPISSIRGVLIV